MKDQQPLVAIALAEGLLLRRDMQQIAADFAQWSAAYDVVLTPTLAKRPLATGEFQPKAVDALALRLLGRLGAGRARTDDRRFS